jgi:predicted transcriptional regulator
VSRKTTTYTPEARLAMMAAIAARVEHGVSLPDAATAEGARSETVRTWLRRGRREDSGPYADFARAIREARKAAGDRPEPMDADELAKVVSEMARKGSVQAAKLRWEMLRAPDGQERPAADEFDELKARRAAHGG